GMHRRGIHSSPLAGSAKNVRFDPPVLLRSYAKRTKRAIFDHPRQQTGRVRHQPRLARTFVRQRLPSMPQIPPGRSAPAMHLSVGATDERDRPLPVAGFKGTPEKIERQWYEQVYRGRGDSMAQLTWRAVLIGSCLGGVLSLTNLYIGL